MSVIRSIHGSKHYRLPERSPRLRKLARRAGTVFLGVIALDLIATAITLAFGWSMVR